MGHRAEKNEEAITLRHIQLVISGGAIAVQEKWQGSFVQIGLQ